MSQADAISAFTVKSAGTNSPITELSPCTTLNKPAPPATIAPVGPKILSTQPGTGSRYVDNTEIRQIQQIIKTI